mmetsp:Transcript_51168/g.153732  ORF Transcript_51168/g.153732 Transcript_51168/m.153732 type:complete len:218 (+) Transcript_51168:435-1088(+)
MEFFFSPSQTTTISFSADVTMAVSVVPTKQSGEGTCVCVIPRVCVMPSRCDAATRLPCFRVGPSPSKTMTDVSGVGTSAIPPPSRPPLLPFVAQWLLTLVIKTQDPALDALFSAAPKRAQSYRAARSDSSGPSERDARAVTGLGSHRLAGPPLRRAAAEEEDPNPDGLGADPSYDSTRTVTSLNRPGLSTSRRRRRRHRNVARSPRTLVGDTKEGPP